MPDETNPLDLKPDGSIEARTGEKISESIGGVQGEKETEKDVKGEDLETVSNPEQDAPDAGEIEWSGGFIKNPPVPSGG